MAVMVTAPLICTNKYDSLSIKLVPIAVRMPRVWDDSCWKNTINNNLINSFKKCSKKERKSGKVEITSVVEENTEFTFKWQKEDFQQMFITLALHVIFKALQKHSIITLRCCAVDLSQLTIYFLFHSFKDMIRCMWFDWQQNSPFHYNYFNKC